MINEAEAGRRPTSSTPFPALAFPRLNFERSNEVWTGKGGLRKIRRSTRSLDERHRSTFRRDNVACDQEENLRRDDGNFESSNIDYYIILVFTMTLYVLCKQSERRF